MIIYFWHGIDEKSLVYKTIKEICSWNEEMNHFVYEDSIETFVVEFKFKFIYLPKDTSRERECPMIGVTHKNTFGQYG